MPSDKPDVDKSSYSCCAGFAYYSKAMQDKGLVPRCMGVHHKKEGNLRAEDSQHLPPNTTDYQFVCIGFSAHPYPNGTSGGTIPYCEGIELVSYEEATAQAEAGPRPGQAMSQQAIPGSTISSGAVADVVQQRQLLASSSSRDAGEGSSGSSSSSRDPASSNNQPPASGSGRPTDGSTDPDRSLSGRFLARANRNLESMRATLQNQGLLRIHSFTSTKDVTDRLWQVGCNNIRKMETAASLASGFVLDKCSTAWQALGSSRREGPDVGGRERAGES